jgi:hypothetical protein
LEGIEAMIRTNRDPRTTDTRDLSARLRSRRRSCEVGRVLNVGGGGMLIDAGNDLDNGETAWLELSGPDFRYAAVAEVVHHSHGATGLRFVSWQGPADRCVRALVAARLRGQQFKSQHPEALAVGCATVWNSRQHDRAAVGGLSVAVELSAGDASRCYPVLNVSEQGMLIDGLTRPVGARVFFRLAGRGVSHLGRGRVAHQTGATAGVAVNHWCGAPDAIRALVSGTAQVGLPPADVYVAEWS